MWLKGYGWLKRDGWLEGDGYSLRDMCGFREMGGFGYGWLDVRRWSCDSLILNVKFNFSWKL